MDAHEMSLATLPGSVLAQIDELEDGQIVAALSGQVSAAWVYEFKLSSGQMVRGLSSKGVEEAAREMAKLGEALRELDVRIEYEDAEEARFIARASRWAISADGREVQLDAAIRGTRQSKWIRHPDGSRTEDPHWYEKGVTKAVRNAKDALIPNEVRASILASATGRQVRVVESAPARPRASSRRTEPTPPGPGQAPVPSTVPNPAPSDTPPIPVAPKIANIASTAPTGDLATRFWAAARKAAPVGQSYMDWGREYLHQQTGATDWALLDHDEQERVLGTLEAVDVS